jgi:uncharacterized cofD-like protein
MKKVVVIGGGSGIFNVLKGLKNYPVEITSIVTTFDNGGSTGILRDEFGTLPQGDIRRSLIALAPDTGDSILRDIFNFRFPKESSLNGHSFGNLFLQALTTISGSEVGAIKKAAEILNIKHAILPISTDNAELWAELEDGSIIKGETNIDIPKHDGNKKIKKVYLKPNAIMYSEAYDAIMNADLVIIGPGDLYTSIIPNLLVEGFTDAIAHTKAKILYVLNVMTKWGETNNFTGSDFANTLLSYLKKDKVDIILCNNAPLKIHLQERYEKEKGFQVMFDIADLQKYGSQIIREDLLLQTDDIIRHDPQKIARAIMKILSTDIH